MTPFVLLVAEVAGAALTLLALRPVVGPLDGWDGLLYVTAWMGAGLLWSLARVLRQRTEHGSGRE